MEDAESVADGLLPEVQFPLILVLQVEAAHHVCHFGAEGAGLVVVAHQEGQLELADVGESRRQRLVIAGHDAVGQVELGV